MSSPLQGIDSHDKLMSAISSWLGQLDSIPGWKEWKKASQADAFFYDHSTYETNTERNEFNFPEAISAKHDLIGHYLSLHSAWESLCSTEQYVRNYPFSKTGIVSKHEHLRYMVEVFFFRIYEFEEKLEKTLRYTNKIQDTRKNINFKAVIAEYRKEFSVELKHRHDITHHNKTGYFTDIRLDNLYFISTVRRALPDNPEFKQRELSAYRRASRELSGIIKHKQKRVRIYLDITAHIILDSCSFLHSLEP